VQTFMAAVGLLAVYFLLRNLIRIQVVIRATLRLNDAFFATDPSFRAFTPV
jgi:hypothetical protein